MAQAKLSAFSSILLLLALSIAPRSSYAFDCKILVDSTVEDLVFPPSLERPVHRFPKIVQLADRKDSHLQFGFESEYTLSEIGPMLSLYAPKESLGLTHGDWQKLSTEQRVQWVNEHIDDIFPTARESGGLELMNAEAMPSFLPRQLIRDATGNIEIVIQPIDTLEGWFSAVSFINAKMGIGSMQATASVPGEVFLGTGPYANAMGHQRSTGFFRVSHEIHTLEKLEAGYNRFVKDPSKPVALSFQHPFLGPMTKAKQERLDEYLIENAKGGKFDAASAKYVAGSDSSFKYMGGIVYRPDLVGARRTVTEARDAHKRVDTLIDRVLWSSFHFTHSRKIFQTATQITPVDTVKDFAKFPQNVQTMLKTLFPNKALPGAVHNPEEILALDVFRNFAYPLKKWQPVLQFIQRTDLTQTVATAQKSYVDSNKGIAARLEAGSMKAAEAAIQVQGALAKFSVESRLAEAMRGWRQKAVYETDEWKDFISAVPTEILETK